jgi:hypothetical protein
MTATTVGVLAVPVITDDMSTLDAADAYAKAGWYIGAAERGTKHPGSTLGKDWQRKTSRDPQVIAAWFAGTDHGVFLHAGRSGAIIFDVDHPDRLPAPIRQAIDQYQPPYQSTRHDHSGRGHYVFAVPEGRRFSNSTGQLGDDWGQIRGENGVIIVQPSEHEKSKDGGRYLWLHTGPVPVLPGYLASRLPEATEAADAATDAHVAAFLAQYRQAGRPELLDIQLNAWKKKLRAGASRHSTVIGHLTGAMKEAKAGLVDAQLAADTFQSVFEPAVMADPVGPEQGKARTLSEARSEWSGVLAWAVAQAFMSDPAETTARADREAPKNQWEGIWTPDDPPPSASGSAPLPPQSSPDDFWTARPILEHVLHFARARRVGPWALLGCVLVRIIANTTSKIVIPALAGGQVSLNLYAGIVAFTGGGKGTAESASREAIRLPHVDVVGPGSGEGIGHLFRFWDSKEKKLVPTRSAAILSAAEVSTLNAMKARSASTLFPELNKAWMGEPLGFAYVAKEKSLHIEPHSYRLCLITGVQPANATVILDDVDSGSPARYLWMPTGDLGAPIVRPDQPAIWQGWTLANSVGNLDSFDPTPLRPMEVCQTAQDAVDQAALDRLHEKPVDLFNSHALLSRLKTAAALALSENRAGAITEEDWQLAGVIHAVSDFTRQRMIDMLAATKTASNRARAESEAHRAIVVDSKLAEHSMQRAGQAIMRKLSSVNGDGWISRSELRRSLASKDREYFDVAIDALELSGQVEERERDSEKWQERGTEYRSKR